MSIDFSLLVDETWIRKFISFVPCVLIQMVRKGQITDFSLDISPIFMFIVLYYHWFALLLQGLKLYPPEAGEFLQWKRTYSAVCVALKILILRTLQKMRLNWSIPLFARTHLSQCVELWNLPSKSQWKLSDFDTRLVRKVFFDPCIKIFGSQKLPNVQSFVMYLQNQNHVPHRVLKASMETCTLLKLVFGWKWLIYLGLCFRIVTLQVFQFVQFILIRGVFQNFFPVTTGFSSLKFASECFLLDGKFNQKAKPQVAALNPAAGRFLNVSVLVWEQNTGFLRHVLGWVFLKLCPF